MEPGPCPRCNGQMFSNWDNDWACLQCGGVVVIHKPLHVPRKMRLKGEQRHRAYKVRTVPLKPTKLMLEIADMLAKGMSAKDIAQRRGVTLNTIKAQVGVLFSRLEISGRRGIPVEKTYQSWLQTKGT